MEKQNSPFDRLKLPTRIIVNRSELTTAALADIVQKGEYSPESGDTCALAAGSQVIARGKLVRRRGRYFFKVLEMAREEPS